MELAPASRRCWEEAWENLWPFPHPGWDRLLQHRVEPEPGQVQDRAGAAVGFCLGAFLWFLTALISLAEDPCVLPVGSCGFFLSCKWWLLELVTQGGFIFPLPGDR